MPKLNPHRVPMARLTPETRVHSFDEVDLGYSQAEALLEAARCLQCPTPRCVEACPAHNDIPGYIQAVIDGDHARAVGILARTTSFPAICGRVCDHARQCEGACVVGRRYRPVAIGSLERFVGDWARANDVRALPTERPPATGRTVAVVGAGPAGLAAAGELVRQGHQVDVFDKQAVPGGVLAAGIPAFRLPSTVLDWYVEGLTNLGVRIYPATRLGGHFSVDFLLEAGYDAVFLGFGTSTPTWPGVPGERLRGVWQASSFLAQARNAGARPTVGRRVVVVGAGNTAMDAAQTARRLGADEVLVLYRRSAAEVPARSEEVESAEEEGVHFHFLAAPVRFLADAEGQVEAIECIQMHLGEPGPDGRARPEPTPGSEFLLPAETVVLALGFTADPAALPFLDGVAVDGRGRVAVDPTTGRTSRPGVWAGGDLVTGPDTVVRAMAAGRRAAADIHRAFTPDVAPAPLMAEREVVGASA